MKNQSHHLLQSHLPYPRPVHLIFCSEHTFPHHGKASLLMANPPEEGPQFTQSFPALGTFFIDTAVNTPSQEKDLVLCYQHIELVPGATAQPCQPWLWPRALRPWSPRRPLLWTKYKHLPQTWSRGPWSLPLPCPAGRTPAISQPPFLP